MQTPQQKLQTLLRQLFRADAADLDFGIYRIINYRRTQLQTYINQELPDIVQETLNENTAAETAYQELAQLEGQIRETFGDAALTADGNLIGETFRQTPLGQQYLTRKQQLGSPQTQTERADAVFNHLYTFFSRYYENGDFIPRRRYSQTERYAIPYNGQEVYLHWANRDQYYVKSGEYFATYRFRAQNITVTFDLRKVDLEKDNVKGARRFFIPLSAETTYSSETSEVCVPFEYRPLTDEEKSNYGTTNQQDKIIGTAEPEILESLVTDYDVLAALERKTGEKTVLRKNLETYTRRNTADFFIHKDLRGFLQHELDVYIKNEVIPPSTILLNKLEGGGQGR